MNIESFNNELSGNYEEYDTLCPFRDNDEWNELRDERINIIMGLLSSVKACQLSYSSNRYMIIHPSTKQVGFYQISFFNDALMPISDIMRDSIYKIACELVNYNFNLVDYTI